LFDGKIKSSWSGGIADDGRFLMQDSEKFFYENGKTHYEANYELGKKIGAEIFRSRDGTIEWRWDHYADCSATWTQFWEYGNKKSESRWKNFKADGNASGWA